jgi:hypothetical protein
MKDRFPVGACCAAPKHWQVEPAPYVDKMSRQEELNPLKDHHSDILE